MVITVKRDKSIKIALDARVMNENIKKDNYQMPNLDDLLSTLAGIITQDGKRDSNCAFGQVFLNLELGKHCNFAIFDGKSSGIFRFITGFYRIKNMRTEFRRIMKDKLIEVQNVFTFIDDVSIVTKGAKGEHEAKVREVLQKLDRKLQPKEKNAKYQKIK